MVNQYVTVGGYEDYTNSYGNPFEIAAGYLVGPSGIQNFVESQILYAQGIADTATSTAYGTIDALKNVQLIVPPSLGPPLPSLDFTFGYKFTLPDPTTPNFGSITEYTLGSAPDFTGDTSITVPVIPDFDPSFTTLYLPSYPDWEDPDPLGAVPTITDPVFPTAPTFVEPNLPTFSTINLPADPNITLPDLELDYPEFEAIQPSTVIEWNEPEYTPEIIDETIKQIRVFLAGGTGIRADVEEAMFARASEREDRIASQAVQEVVDEYAGRGFTLPPGMLQRRIDIIRAERDLKKQGLSREILIKVMDTEIENLRFAVDQGRQAEELFVRIFLAAVERAFLVARSAVEFAIELYRVQVEVFRAKQEEVKTRAMVYQTQVQAALAQVEIFKALIDAELAKVEIDKAKVDLYNAQIVAMRTYVEKYEAEVRAESEKLKAVELQIRAFAETVRVYTAQLEANKIRYDAFESRVRGELGKAQITESEARAYAAKVQGISTGVSAEARAVEANVSAFNAEISAFVAESQALRDKANVQLAGIQANVAGYEAATQRYVADSGRQEALARLELASWNAGLEGQLGYYRAQLAKYETDIRLLAEQARIALGGLEAAGGLATTIVGGSLAAMHVGATISGSGGVSASGSLSESYGTSKSINASSDSSESIIQSIEQNINADAPDASITSEPPWGIGNVNNVT